MVQATIQEAEQDGLTCLVAETADLRLAILPEMGAKVVSLVLKSTGREYLWRHPGRPLRRPVYGDAFENYDISGWDECFPSISEVVYPEGAWKGVVVPDHGELWTLPWHWDFQANTLRMWTHSVRFGYRFERAFTFADDGTVGIQYSVYNPTAFALKALWSMHPFFNVSPLSRVLLPPGVRVRVELSVGERLGGFLSEHPWPTATDRQGQTVDLGLMGPRDQGYAEKLFSTVLPEGWAALYDAGDDSFLAFTFDPAEVPFMGVCTLRGGWPTDVPSYSTILEPCAGWPDRLDLAMTRGACVVVPAEGELYWKVGLHLGHGRDKLERLIGQTR